MIGYLIYDQRDIKRNITFIEWFLKSSQEKNMTLTLYDDQNDFSAVALPDYVINRSRKVDISQYYEQLNIPVFNSALVTELGNDKYKTYEFFNPHIKMMPTRLATKPLIFPCVIKERSGHGGEQVFLLHHLDDMKDEYSTNQYIVQPLCDQLGKDLRVYVINNEIIASVLRYNPNDFKSNYSLGGSISLYELNDSEIQLVKKIIDLLPMAYAGIDFLFDKNNELILNEIEDVVGARMLYNLKEINIVDLYLEHIKKTIS